MDTILKWVGGKGKCIKHLSKIITPELLSGHRYFEPFAGSAALALYLEHRDTVLNDINTELINLYKAIKNTPEELISSLKVLAKLHEDHGKDAFYEIRDLDRSSDWLTSSNDHCEKEARTLYLNRTCFNGLYRVNQSGYFNVPLGRTISGKLPEIVQEEKIRKLHEYLQTVDLRNTDFVNACVDAKPGDVIYFDPPYDKPEADPTEFTMYHKAGFTRDDLVRLKDLCKDLISKQCNVVISNNDTEFVRDLFSDFSFMEIETHRSINPESKTRRLGKELIIYSLN